MALILLAIPSSPALGGHYPRCFRASFLSQCLLHSSHTSALLAWEAPDHARMFSASMCACGTETAVEERGALPELVWHDSFPDVWLLFSLREIAGMLWRPREAMRRRNATSSDFIICYHVEFVGFCFSQYRHILVLIELPTDITLS